MKILAFTLLFGFTVNARGQDTPATATSDSQVRATDDQAAAFAKQLSGRALVGVYTVDGQSRDKPPKTERYEIESVTPVTGDLWTFVARVKYGANDVRMPMTLPVVWAGDTPVVSLTDQTIPGLGTFSARVLFHGDRYVGTWQHGAVGGHMFGSIESSAADAKPTDDATQKPTP